MTPREIIAEAWAITKREKPLRRWGIASSFLETLFATKLLIYQAWFFVSYMQGRPIGFFDDVLWLQARVPTAALVAIVTVFLVLLAIEWIFPNLARGAIIGLTAKSHRKEEVKGGLVLAIYNFFPMLGLHELFVLASLANTVTIISLILRYIAGDFKYAMIGFVVLFWIISNILKFMASFAEPAVVVKRVSIFAGLGSSFKLILSYLNHVMFLWLLLLVITIRVAFNALLVLLIPTIAVGIGLLLANVLSPLYTLLIAIGIGVLLLFIASYFFAYLHVFKEAVWTVTYFELKKHKDLLVIEE
ncbi:MAG: hypothetical protein WCV62_04220 [Candidatus Peribacteraceae bacterium]|jgi:hypothetical protein